MNYEKLYDFLEKKTNNRFTTTSANCWDIVDENCNYVKHTQSVSFTALA